MRRAGSCRDGFPQASVSEAVLVSDKASVLKATSPNKELKLTKPSTLELRSLSLGLGRPKVER